MKIRIIFDNNNANYGKHIDINQEYTILYIVTLEKQIQYDLPESPKTLLVSSSIQPIYFEIH